ncbi:MAG: ATP-dependent DNA helicase [Thermoprotei archaeon]|nr:ATP-dependent DNA helicase [Thermoprotei archaeon]
MRIDELPLPPHALSLIKERGIKELYPPQEEAIRAGILNGTNVVVSIPTAAGKTLIAELAMLKAVLEGRGKALYMVPLKALANEKYEEFQRYEKLGLRVALSTGDYDSADAWLEGYDIIVSTNEKVDSLLRHSSPWISEVAILVADEVHLLNYADRGPTLEVVLTRLMQVNPEMQVLALSATIRNAEELASWLNAKLVKSEWRPVPLKEGVYYYGEIVYADGSIDKVDVKTRHPVVDLVVDALNKGGEVLVFSNTRYAAVSTARKLRGYVSRLLSKSERRKLKELAVKISESAERTKISEELANDVANGVAFHHAGLSYAHRRLVESGFRESLIKVVVATPTLAAGVNLPARRVVIASYKRYDPGLGYYEIPILEYKQMAGRAGRPTYDIRGEAILVAKSEDEVDYLLERYVNAEPERIWSKLGSEPALRSHVLAIIASGIVNSHEGLMNFMRRTFYAYQHGTIGIHHVVAKVLDFLAKEDFIDKGEFLKATGFGKRVSELYVDPLSAVRIRKGLQMKPPAGPTPLSYLHLICQTPDMPTLYLRRGEYEHYAAYVEAHEDEFFIPPPEEYEDPEGYEMYLAEVKTALLLNDWIEEVPEDQLVREYDVGPGDIHNLTQTAQWLLHASGEIARYLGLSHHVRELERLTLRMKYGVRPELLELVKLKGIGRIRARMLFQAGYRTLDSLRRASIKELLQVPLIGAELVKSIKSQLGEEVDEEVLKQEKNRGTLMYWM